MDSLRLLDWILISFLLLLSIVLLVLIIILLTKKFKELDEIKYDDIPITGLFSLNFIKSKGVGCVILHRKACV